MRITSDMIGLPALAQQIGVGRVTVFYWATRGVRGVVLETTRVGRRLFATKSAVERFQDALNSASL